MSCNHVGPTDAPLLSGVPPEGWWDNNAQEIFGAAECISRILLELNEHDAPLVSPFAGFCAFQAAALHIYTSAFPNLNRGRSLEASTLAKRSIDYLKGFADNWKRADGWVRILSCSCCSICRVDHIFSFKLFGIPQRCYNGQ